MRNPERSAISRPIFHRPQGLDPGSAFVSAASVSTLLPASSLLRHDTGARPTVSTPRLTRAAIIIAALHATLLSVMLWMIFDQLLSRTIADLQPPVTSAFISYAVHVATMEFLVAAAAGLAIAGVTIARGYEADRRLAATAAVSYAVPALYSAAIIAAFVAGWEVDVWVMSATDATDPQVAATVADALPVVLEPLAIGRQGATVVAAIAFGILQRRLCDIGGRQAALTAGAAGAAALATYALGWSAAVGL